MNSKVKDPVSGFSHLAGAILSAIGLYFLVRYAATNGTVWHIVSFSIFGASLILLYTASSVYHLLIVCEKSTKILRKIDHMMIYVLIAGTYTPVCLIPLRGGWGWSLLISIWGIAMTGIILKILWLDAPRWLYTLFYVLMGWLIIVAFVPLINALPAAAMLWLIAGGLLYTIGAIIYGTKWPRLKSKVFGFHEIFHIFVLYGSFCHFWLMLRYVLYL
ncbi:MAG TPA: hemolysin III family protein [Bacillota bacterium]|nr:hemolysin III family protein [Bacillota bacterium]HOR86307.1 hemolysin III family protein [Bacillota bacterium]HPL54566.1 hemolysin III family protein [Bacillota bacterium]